jgi:hypothetical protein
MSTRIPEVETSVDLLRSIIWQYDNAESVKSLISQKNEWYKKEQAEFWDNWYRDVFDIRTANDFGLEIWSIILGVSFLVPDCPGKVLTTEQKRLICRLRYYQLISRCTIPEVNAITMNLFATKEGKAYALDPLDMSYIMYVFTEQPTSAVALILAKYDLLPRPATVGLKYRVIRNIPFGFGPHYQNFENAGFWDGGELINYAWSINLSFDDSTGTLSGVINSSDSAIDLSGVDVTLFYTNSATGRTFTRDVSTVAGGIFTDTVPDSDKYTVVAKAQIFTPICTTDNVESRPLEFRHIVSGAQFVMRFDSPSRPLFYVNMSEDFTVDYGDGIDSKDFTMTEINGGYGLVYATRNLTVGEEYTITVKRSDTMRFFVASGTTTYTFNTLREIIRVSGNRTSMTAFATNNTGLYSIRKGAFDYLPNATWFETAFMGCTSLVSLPAGLFDHCTGITSFYRTWRDCTNLTLLPVGLFKNCSLASTFQEAFFGCTSLISLPEGLFSGLANVKTYQYAFYQCTALTALPDNLFADNDKCTSFYGAFQSCSELKIIGNGVFKNCKAVTSFYYCFSGCTKLTMMPKDLFVDCISATTFQGAFYNCKSLVEIPSGVFSNIGGGMFQQTFFGCSGLLTIPDNLFKGLSNATNFDSTFYGCLSIKTIGNSVFKGCSSVTTFNQVFYGCSSLVTVGDNIFSGCTSVTTFANAFYSCSSLTYMPLFTDCNKVTTFSRCFYRCLSLKEVTPYAFENKKLVSTFASVFQSCIELKTVPNGVFNGCSNNTSFQYAFQGCTGLLSLSGDMFEGCTKVSDIQYLFDGCSALSSLPSNLFNSFTGAISSVVRAFGSCTSLTELPKGLFDNCAGITALTSMFLLSSNLRALPDGLFKHCKKLTTVSGVFANCDIREIPVDTFANCTLIAYFDSAFNGCRNLMGIPEDLFKDNINAITFSSVFTETGITYIPSGLFRNNAKATNFSYAFSSCPDLVKVGDGLFNGTSVTLLIQTFRAANKLDSNINSIFNLPSYPTITNTSNMFSYGYLVAGSGLQLIGALPSVTAANNKGGTFTQAYALSDYNLIPVAWGGGGA